MDYEDLGPAMSQSLLAGRIERLEKRMTERPDPALLAGQMTALDRQSRVQALDMAMRYFAGKSPEQLVKNAAVFETYIKEGHRNE